ncbi:MAG TPA: family 43 glycosylhydrolase, partial [Thermomicrobiales bacterium]|nr:family 43 glycosylhydrolase [Thermomicrobiales bacterium]
SMTGYRKRLLAEVHDQGDGRSFKFRADAPADGLASPHAERIVAREQADYLDLFARLAPVLGSRVPRNRRAQDLPRSEGRHRPLLTSNISPEILSGYGDPSVLWVEEHRAWYMVVTSNDAPNSFPILRTTDLKAWELVDFVFPEGRKPAWAADGPKVSDFWAPELHRMGDEFVVCFAAREPDQTMSLGLARSRSPAGPFDVPRQPLLRGGVIDAHLYVDPSGAPVLYWKEDSNGVWPRLLVELFLTNPAIAHRLLPRDEDARTADVVAALWPAARSWPPMEQFFVLQPLIEAVVDNFAEVRSGLKELSSGTAEAILSAMRTPIFAQRLDWASASLTGAVHTVLVNDLDWEAHLIEGPWLCEHDGRFYLFYSGNDFSTHEYGIGVAIGHTPTGPFTKLERPLLRSDHQWIGPGHPSVTPGPDGRPQLFYHAFAPGNLGYNVFRALLTCRLHFADDRVEVLA